MKRRAFALLSIVAAASLALTGCVSAAQRNATDKAREQLAGAQEYFAAAAPAPGSAEAADFASFVRGQGLGYGTPEFGDGHVGISTGTILYDVDDTGTVWVAVGGYGEVSEGFGGLDTRYVYACFTVTFDLVGGGDPEYADVTCPDRIRLGHGPDGTDTDLSALS